MRPLARRHCSRLLAAKIDLLVADYLLPGISGVEMMRKIRARNAELKVIFISGMTAAKRAMKCSVPGAVAIFDKPIPLGGFSGFGRTQSGFGAHNLPA